MTAKKLIYVHLRGTGVSETFKALSHEIVGLPADTYHKFVMENGATIYYNGFGIRSVIIADSVEALS